MSEMSAAEAAIVARFDAAEPAPESWRGDDGLRSALLRHHPIMRSEDGPLSGCRCGSVGLGQDVIAHVMAEVEAWAEQRARERAAEELRAAAGMPRSYLLPRADALAQPC